MRTRKYLSILTVIVVICATIVGYNAFYVKEAIASFNSHSIDFERSSSQYLSISDGSQAGLDLTGDLTLEAWVKWESSDPNTNYAFVSKWSNNASTRNYRWYWGNNTTDADIILLVNDGGTIRTLNVGSLSIPSTGVWVHYAVAYDESAGQAEFFINGSSIGSDAVSAPHDLVDEGGDFRIGFDDVGSYMDGLMDDVRVWNDVRTGMEISNNKNKELLGDEANLQGYWRLNNSLTDKTLNGNDLTNNNGATFSTENPSFEALSAIKTGDESVSSSTTLQDDDELKIDLEANTAYSIQGVVFVTSTSPSHINMGFDGESSFDVALAMTNDMSSQVLLQPGASGSAIVIPENTPTAIHIKGTVQTKGDDGALQLEWAQGNSSADAVTVLKGSYLKAEEL